MQKVMAPSNSGMHLTEQFEGCRYVAYFDRLGKVWTIAYGHTDDVHEGMTCTKSQAEVWLQIDRAKASLAINRLVLPQLTQDEFDALVDFVFNLGVGDFAKSSLLRLINLRKFSEAAAEFDKWDHSGGKIVQGLLRRREAENALFLKDETTDAGNTTT